MNVDDRSLIDFGVTKIGNWDEKGMLQGVRVDDGILADDLPRWLFREPVITLDVKPLYNVYLRGLYSEKLTKQRRAAVFKH